MELLNNNLAEILVFLGLALLAIEVLVLGFSTFVLVFVGLACVLTGALMYIGVLPESAVTCLVSVSVLTGALACILWKPMKKMQNKVVHKPVTSDLVGYSFELASAVSAKKHSQHSYSGIVWEVKSDEAIAAGTEVEVVDVQVGAFIVAATQSLPESDAVAA